MEPQSNLLIYQSEDEVKVAIKLTFFYLFRYLAW